MEKRNLPEIRYLTLDATYYKVRIDGSLRDCSTLREGCIGISDLVSSDAHEGLKAVMKTDFNARP